MKLQYLSILFLCDFSVGLQLFIQMADVIKALRELVVECRFPLLKLFYLLSGLSESNL
jgi:hypothetical protein